MSAIDRAFIKAYSDEQVAASEPSRAPARRSSAAEARTANAATAPAKAAATAQSPRRGASRTRRSVAAAAIRADEPAANAAAMPSDPEAVASIAPSTQAASATVESKPKMVVGRRALQKLAESAVVPTPHMSFGQARRAVGHSIDDRDSDVAPRVATVGGDVSTGRSIEKPAVIDSRGAESTAATAAGSKPPQYRLDPAVATAASIQRSSNSGPPQMTAQNAPSMPRVASVEPPAKDLRSLSSYRIPGAPAAPVAALEVDCLVWPPACRLLIERAGSELESAAAMLAEQITNGSQTIAICSVDDGQGCTTVVLCLALKLAAQGMRVCLVDGNISHPQLAELVGLEPECGLESILAGEATLSEVLIESLEDRLTLLPLCKPLRADTIERSKLRQTVTFGELRDQFDAVLVDAGCVGSPAARASIIEGGSIDAAVLVGCASEERIAWQRARRALEQWSVPCWGAIENRCAL
jgi:Mrp family chromosome partitioning ATPase